MGYGMMGGAGQMDGWAGMAFGGVMMLLWFVLIAGLIVLVVKWVGGTPWRNSGRDALDTVKQRYANGEIDTAEFEERSRRLRASE